MLPTSQTKLRTDHLVETQMIKCNLMANVIEAFFVVAVFIIPPSAASCATGSLTRHNWAVFIQPTLQLERFISPLNSLSANAVAKNRWLNSKPPLPISTAMKSKKTC